MRHTLLLVGSLSLLILAGCRDTIFSNVGDCPTPGTPRVVRITAKILNLDEGVALRSLGGYQESDNAKPFAPVSESDNAFERQITTIRVLGFYADDVAAGINGDPESHRKGEIAFNKLFFDHKALTSLGRTLTESAVMLTEPGTGGELILEFETDRVGNFDVVLVANEPLDGISRLINPVDKGFPEQDWCNKVVQETPSRPLVNALSLAKIKKVEELQKAMITTPQYQVEDWTAPKANRKRYQASYCGALPAKGWLYSNGGIPMVGQGSFAIAQPTSGLQQVSGETKINLERMLAKIELNYSNTTEQGQLYGRLRYPQQKGRHIHSVELNNYPRFALLLPVQRSASTPEFSTRGAAHKYYSTAQGNHYVNLYYAKEKALNRKVGGVEGQRLEDILPFNIEYQKLIQNDPAGEVSLHFGLRYRPSYFFFGYRSPDSDPVYPLFGVDWLPYVRPNSIVKRDGTPLYYYQEGTTEELKRYTNLNNRDYKPTVLYALPTTAQMLPAVSGNGISSDNGVTDRAQEPTEVIVTAATYTGERHERDEKWTYDPTKEEKLVAYRFRLFNNDNGGDKYAIRRNTIYRFNIVWQGQDEIVLYRSKVRVLPWNVQEYEYSY